jgi:hypothetical protein
MARVLRSHFQTSCLLATVLLTGCGRAPSFNILGSYFPAWLICVLAGIAVTSLVSFLLERNHLTQLIRWTLVVYPCLAASVAFTFWLLFFS